jgi:hypothetical protein
MTYWKAVTFNLRSFHDQATLWTPGTVNEITGGPRLRPAETCSDAVLHASPTPLDALGWHHGPLRYATLVEVSGRRVTDINGHPRKAGFRKLTSVRVVARYGMDELLGFKYTEACDPFNPRTIVPVIDAEAIDLCRQWDSIWASVRDGVWDSIWASVRDGVWDGVWDSIWDSIWDSVGDGVGGRVRDSVRASVWDSVGGSVRASVWAYIGSLFPGITSWSYIDHDPGAYPFQSAVDLWCRGLVPSFDGRQWRLHGGPDMAVLWNEGDEVPQ